MLLALARTRPAARTRGQRLGLTATLVTLLALIAAPPRINWTQPRERRAEAGSASMPVAALGPVSAASARTSRHTG